MHEQSLYTAEEKESSALEVPMAEQAFLLFLLTTHISLYVILYIERQREQQPQKMQATDVAFEETQ